jgi:hypothetical protein
VGPARATVITYVNPAVAVALGVIVLHEPFTPEIGAAFALILAGSVMATRSGLPVRGRRGGTVRGGTVRGGTARGGTARGEAAPGGDVPASAEAATAVPIMSRATLRRAED